MKMLNIIRYLKGYVHFTAEGGFPERFINICAAKSIHLWALTPDIKRLDGCVSAKSFLKLRTAARNSGVKLSVRKKVGLPFFLKKHKHRAVLFGGVFFYILTVIFMNQFIWFIDVEGTSTVSHALIMDTLENFGLKTGVYAKKADTDLLNREGVNSFSGELMWMSVNIKGSKAVIEVRDYVDEHEDATYKDPCNIVADFSGTVLSVEIFNGDRVVSAGNAVKKGDLLISGVVENTDLSASYLEARGRITALHDVSLKKTYKLTENGYKRLTKANKSYGIRFLWLKMPKSTDKLGYEALLSINDTVLPFGISTYTKKEFSDGEKIDYTLLSAIDSYTAEYYTKFSNTSILSADTKVKINENSCTISSEISCIDFMGIQNPIYVEN